MCLIFFKLIVFCLTGNGGRDGGGGGDTRDNLINDLKREQQIDQNAIASSRGGLDHHSNQQFRGMKSTWSMHFEKQPTDRENRAG